MTVVKIEETPNPNARKFIVNEPFEQELSFFNAAAAKGYVLAEKLFAVSGVTSLLFLGDFITVNKSSEAKWTDIQKGVTSVLDEA